MLPDLEAEAKRLLDQQKQLEEKKNQLLEEIAEAEIGDEGARSRSTFMNPKSTEGDSNTPEPHHHINETPQPAENNPEMTLEELPETAKLRHLGKTIEDLVPKPIQQLLIIIAKSGKKLVGDVGQVFRFLQRHVKAIVDHGIARSAVVNRRRGQLKDRKEEQKREEEDDFAVVEE